MDPPWRPAAAAASAAGGAGSSLSPAAEETATGSSNGEDGFHVFLGWILHIFFRILHVYLFFMSYIYIVV